jgi:polyferredoxin
MWLVEPLGDLLGLALVSTVHSIFVLGLIVCGWSYAFQFIDEMVPESHLRVNKRLHHNDASR